MSIGVTLSWIAILGLPAAIGFAAALAVTRRVGYLGLALAVAVFPVGLAILTWLTYSAVDPDAGCSEECWGVIPYLAGWVGATAGAELGLVAGAIAKAIARGRIQPPASA